AAGSRSRNPPNNAAAPGSGPGTSVPGAGAEEVSPSSDQVFAEGRPSARDRIGEGRGNQGKPAKPAPCDRISPADRRRWLDPAAASEYRSARQPLRPPGRGVPLPIPCLPGALSGRPNEPPPAHPGRPQMRSAAASIDPCRSFVTPRTIVAQAGLACNRLVRDQMARLNSRLESEFGPNCPALERRNQLIRQPGKPVQGGDRSCAG